MLCHVTCPLRHETTTSSSEGETPTNSVTTPSGRPLEFRQVMMHAQNQIILTQVLSQDKEKVCGGEQVDRLVGWWGGGGGGGGGNTE